MKEPCFQNAAFLAFLPEVFLSKAAGAKALFPSLKNLMLFIFSVSLSAECPRPSLLRPGNVKHPSPVMQEGIKAIFSMLFSSFDKPSGGKPLGAKEHHLVSKGLFIACTL